MKKFRSSLERDFVASNLRAQVSTLQRLLEGIEQSDDSGNDYALESLRRVEVHIRKLRNFLNN
ncbi:MAG: hypothetical protein JW867_07865 [Candidatus Omnitrophica bacterium]|nr:hypothetical protein [Candidatus Omnitrophota bacterium]